jgi:lipopolysaccharide/colanic/teichoic acid biosynthesis glycosyltransferase
MMQRGILLAVDLWLVAAATILALVLRENFEVNTERWAALLTTYLPISIVMAGGVFAAGGLDRCLWRYSSITDYLHIVVLTVAAVLLIVGSGFAINRLDGIPRSLPILQTMLVAGALVSARVIVRLVAERRNALAALTASAEPAQTILIVGINALSDLFLRSVRENAAQQVRVAGLLSVDPLIRGRMIQRNQVLGTVENLREVLEMLHVHGVTVDRIVVAVPRQRLSPRAIEVLRHVEQSSGIAVQILSQRLGLDRGRRPPADPGSKRRTSGAASCDKPHAALTDDCGRNAANVSTADAGAGNDYWKLKRVIDVCVAATLLTLIAPLVPVIAAVIAWDVGFPLIFWQQRPGLHGRPFRVYKFRTMRASHDRHFNRVPDDKRLSVVGRVIRNLRIDELPQLWNVLIGDMSLIGPRPLLPQDQSPDFAARLSVRPGLTGWAQVNGGRIISADDKAMLDTWYVKKASFLLDIKIVIRTAKMLLVGDRINDEAVSEARQYFGRELAISTK